MKKPPPTDAEVADTARRLVAARRECKRLEAMLATFNCEKELAEIAELGRWAVQYIGPQPAQPTPCWKCWDDDGDGGRSCLLDGDACEPCIEREKVRDQLKAARASRGALLRALDRRCRVTAAAPPAFDEHDVAPALARDDSGDEEP